MASPSTPPSASSYDDMSDQATMSLKDLEKIFIVFVPKNEKPYKAAVMRCNNNLVREWFSQILERIANDKGDVAVGKTSLSMQLFIEWKEMLRFSSLRKNGLMTFPNTDLVQRWRRVFESTSIEDLHTNYGSGCIITGWNIIESYIKIHRADYMWENFWSKCDDPLWLLDNAHYLNTLSETYASPFWSKEELSDYKEMIMTIMRTPIEPNK